MLSFSIAAQDVLETMLETEKIDAEVPAGATGAEPDAKLKSNKAQLDG